MKAAFRVLLAGGGSGGSATPVLAVAQALRQLRPETEFLYMGTRGGPEARLARAQGLQYAGITTGKLRRYWDVQNLVDPAKVLFGVGQAYALARRFRPSVAFAAGGFASVPPIIAARAAGARALIHQQDVEPGLANRLLVPFARRVTLTMASSRGHFPADRGIVTGNPVRQEILAARPEHAIEALALEPTTKLVVCTGGGTGALGLNRLVAAAVPYLVAECQVVHLTGSDRGVTTPPRSARYRRSEFLVDEMPHLLAAADVVVSRAGMGTLTELAALRKAALVVPMPRSHQCANARAFEALGAIEVAEQERLSGEGLAARVLSLLRDDERREQLGAALAASMPRDAARRIADELIAL